jgi:5-methylcytosine-specific restriction endonuclease McrA
MNALKNPVLKLNAKWQVLKDTTTVQVAMENLCRGAEMGIDTDSMRAVGWDEWIKLPIRETDASISTVRGPIRAPTVVLCARYEGRELVCPPEKPSNQDIRKRDQCICQITGEFAPDGNVDHDIPVSRGGKDTWENLRWMKRELNSQKGNKTLAEMGLKPIRPAQKPRKVAPELVIQPLHPDWNHFLRKRRS